jgi:hypothetical protein
MSCSCHEKLFEGRPVAFVVGSKDRWIKYIYKINAKVYKIIVLNAVVILKCCILSVGSNLPKHLNRTRNLPWLRKKQSYNLPSEYDINMVLKYKIVYKNYSEYEPTLSTLLYDTFLCVPVQVGIDSSPKFFSSDTSLSEGFRFDHKKRSGENISDR